jgi:hypothetical protein
MAVLSCRLGGELLIAGGSLEQEEVFDPHGGKFLIAAGENRMPATTWQKPGRALSACSLLAALRTTIWPPPKPGSTSPKPPGLGRGQNEDPLPTDLAWVFFRSAIAGSELGAINVRSGGCPPVLREWASIISASPTKGGDRTVAARRP